MACNPYVLIDYGAISRSLGLGVLLLLAAILYRHRRWAWLAVAALPMMDFLFGVLSIIAIAFFWRERRLWAPGFALWLACAAAAAWSVRPAPDIIPAFWLNGPVHDGLVELTRFGALLIPLAMGNGHLLWNEAPPAGAALIGGILYIGLGISLLRRDRFLQALLIVFAAVIFLFSMFVYPLAIRHVSLAAMLLVIGVALLPARSGEERWLFGTWLAIGACCGGAMAIANFLRPFDTAPRAAQFILDHHLETKPWAAYPDSRAQGVSALTGVEFERLERNCKQSFIRWNYRSRIRRPEDLKLELERIATRSGSFYLLTDFTLTSAATRNRNAYRQLLYVPEGIDGQAFYLYQIHPELPEKPEKLPQCAPERLPLRILP